MLMLELLLGFNTVTVTALGGALGTEGTQADTTRLKSESCKLQAMNVVARKHKTGEMKTSCNIKFLQVIMFSFFSNLLGEGLTNDKNRLPCF